MPILDGFDAEVYFESVARTLVTQHGPAALGLSIRALEKMRSKGDDEGFHLWLGVQEKILKNIRPHEQEETISIH